jgi:nucleotide-binding universal stress UspA family protein
MKRILIPTDFSEVANNAVRYAIALTRNTKAKYVFFHAGNEDPGELKQNINNVSPIADVVKENVIYESAGLNFNAETIKKAARRHKADLIVIGTHGEKTPLSPKVFGSNTSAIIDGLNIPTIAVPPDFIYSGISKIAFASDLINLSVELDRVIEFAKMVNASIEIIHVSPVFQDFGDAEKTNVEEIMEEAKKKHSYFYLNFFLEKTKHDNQVIKGIDDYIHTHSPDLLALFHISRSWVDKVVMPSATAKEITKIKVPVLIFPKEL